MINREQGIGASEAPRGTLFHEYEVNEDGVLQKVNLVIATAQNNLAMNRTVRQLAMHYLDGTKVTEGHPQPDRGRHPLLRSVPLLLHPCHRAMMPLHVQVVDRGDACSRELRR